jgi:Domain of Unknown Function (DUF1080)
MKRILFISAGLLVAALTLSGCASTSGAGWSTILDGSRPKTLAANWTYYGENNWRFEGGAIVADKRTIPMKGPQDSNFLVTRKSYRNYKLRVEFWVDQIANSGVFLRISDPSKISATSGYEVNIYDTRPDPSYGTGGIVGVAKVDPMPKAAGKWSIFDITADGPHMMVFMDGKKVADGTDGKFAEGPIALQYGGGVIKFRRVQIKQL